ncbi:hypothetical protein V6582_18655 [Agrobacterium vitis]|uniref:hypothetical protein n=1 Tax=Agrobacterium vitis TaxID=373 RepID=UPI0012E82A57|nr:hypothetical protein [Agrobacterium vitis]MVA23354.1 hypothetical protein [Agrobacterium vitis]
MKRLWRVIRISAAAMHRDWVAPDISRLFLKWVEPMKRAADCFYRIGVRLQGVEADKVLNLAGVTTYAAWATAYRNPYGLASAYLYWQVWAGISWGGGQGHAV